MLTLRLLHLVVDNLQVLIELLDATLKIKCFLENLLSVRSRFVHVWVAHHLIEEPVVFLTERVLVLAHMLWKYRIKFILNRAKLAQKCTLLQLDIVQLLHVPLVRLLNLT